MGLFDRLKSLVGGGRAEVVDMRGPLGLAPGDGVGYYRERWLVSGTRRLVHDGQVTWHYCLRDADGGRAALVVEDGPEPSMWVQRVVAAEVPWDTDVLEGVGDEPFRLTARGTATADHAGDTGTPPVRTVEFREFEDSGADRVVVLENWGGQQEIRVGETALEAEITLAHGGAPEGDVLDSSNDVAIEEGTHPHAAEALAHDVAAGDEDVVEGVVREEIDPNGFEDDAWHDEDEAEPEVASMPLVEAVVDSEDDEWLAATRYVREHGLPSDSRSR